MNKHDELRQLKDDVSKAEFMAMLQELSPQEINKLLEAWGKKQIVRELAMIEPMASHQLAATVSDRIAELTEGDK